MNETQIKHVIDNYSKLSNDQLMVELAKQIAKQKQRDGGAGMLTIIERIKPLLNPSQRARLDEVLKSVNG